MELKNIKLTKGMNNENVNELISEWLKLEDEKYLGCEFKHNWKCKCGNIFQRRWNDLRRHENIVCLECRNKKYEKCTICGEKYYAKGLCLKHYYQLTKLGEIKDDSPKTIYQPNEIIEYENYAEVIILNRRYEEKARVKIDLDDIDIIQNYKWTIDGNGYASYNRKRDKNLIMHRLIMNCPDDMVVDHINHDRLDNRKENLRVCTTSQNNMNRDLGRNNKSGCNGVNWHKESQKWIARITVNKKVIYLGVYENLEEAIRVRKEAEIKYFGEYKNQNVMKTVDRKKSRQYK